MYKWLIYVVCGWTSFTEDPSNSVTSMVGSFAGGKGKGFRGANVAVSEPKKHFPYYTNIISVKN